MIRSVKHAAFVLLVACGDDKIAPQVDAGDVDAAQPVALTVTIAGPNEARILVTSEPAGLVCGPGPSSCSTMMPAGTSVTLVGTTDPTGICFTWRWSVCGPSTTGSSCTFTLAAALTVTVSCASAVR